MPGCLSPSGRAPVALAAVLAVAAVALASLWLLFGSASPEGAFRPHATPVSDRSVDSDNLHRVERPARMAGEPDTARVAPDPLPPLTRTPAQARAGTVPQLRVRVLSAPAEPLEGAEVAVFLLPSPPGGHAVARLHSDAEGRCAIRLVALEDSHAFEVASRTLLVRVRREGWRPHEWRLRADQVYRPDFELRAVLVRGGAVLGRVVDPAGGALSGASVTLLVPSTEIDGDLEVVARTSTATDGTFQAGSEPLETRAVLVATHPAHGRARRDVQLTGIAPLQVGDLALEPAGLLSGRVLFPDGRPARRAQVMATSVETSRFARPAPDSLALTGGRMEADEEGRFRFALLEPGVYRLDVGNPYTIDRDFAQRPARTFRTPALDVLLQADHVALCVRVVDPTGHALQGVGVDARRVRAESNPGKLSSSGRLELIDRQWAGTRGVPPCAILAVDPTDRVVLRAELPACHPVQDLVIASAAPGEQEVTLQVFSRADSARPRPRVVGTDGRTVASYSVDVFDPYTRLMVRGGLEPETDGALPALAPGIWILRARTPGSRAHDSGPLPAGLGTTVTLRPDGPQAVELRLE